jgi:hypothetical protein
MTEEQPNKRYTVASVKGEARKEESARVAIDRSRDHPVSDAYFSEHSKGPENLWTHHELTWETSAGGEELPEDLGTSLRVRLPPGANLNTPATSDELLAALGRDLATLGPSFAASFVVEVEAESGAAALEAVKDA